MIKQICAAVAGGLIMVASGTALAQTHNEHARHDGYSQHSHQQHQTANYRHHGMYEQGRKQGWYKKGGHLPRTYWSRQYTVSDWRTHHLRQPPRGYHWVHSDNGDYLLVATATGIIASIVVAALQH